MLFVGFVLYKYYEDKEEAKARDVRKAEYFRQQTIIAEAARAETAKYIEAENKRIAARKAEKALKKRQQAETGAFVEGAASERVLSSPSLVPNASEASDSASYNVSSLHSSENDFDQYKVRRTRKRNSEIDAPAVPYATGDVSSSGFSISSTSDTFGSENTDEFDGDSDDRSGYSVGEGSANTGSADSGSGTLISDD